MDKINEPFINNSIWFKQQYEIANKDGVDFIVIKRGAEKEVYEPLERRILDYRPNNKEEHFLSSPHVALSRINPQSVDEILLFVNTWGLLGLRNTEKYTNKAQLAEIFNNPLLGMDYPQISDLYSDSRRKIGEKAREPIIVFQQAVIDYQQVIMDLLMYKNYELPDVFVDKTHKRDFVEGVMQNEEKEYLQKDSIELQAINTENRHAFITFSRLNEMIDARPQSYWNVKASSYSSGWRFTSLLSALYLRIHLEFHQGTYFTHCKWKKCRRLFVPRNPINQYCSTPCRNNHNAYRFKLNSWLKDVKSQFPNHSEEEVEIMFYSLVDDGYSGEKKILKKMQQRLN